MTANTLLFATIFILAIFIGAANGQGGGKVKGADASYGDHLDQWYPKAKALKEAYSCCAYRDRSEAGQECEEYDDECIDDYRSYMNIYYILALVVFVLAATFLMTWCICSCQRTRR